MSIELTDHDKAALKNMCLFARPEDAEKNLKQYFKDEKDIDVEVDIDLDEDLHTVLVYHPTDKLYIPEDYRILEISIGIYNPDYRISDIEFTINDGANNYEV